MENENDRNNKTSEVKKNENKNSHPENNYSNNYESVQKRQFSEKFIKNKEETSFRKKDIILSQRQTKSFKKEELDIRKLNTYKNYLKQTIQIEASKNYPKASIRKREEGVVQIIFTLNTKGKIIRIDTGSETTASERLVKSLKKVIQNKIVKFKEDKILKKTDTFSLNIVYKLK